MDALNKREIILQTVAEEVQAYQHRRSPIARGLLGLPSIKANDAICRRDFFVLQRR